MALYKWQSVPAPARTEDWIALTNRGLSLTRMVVWSSLVPKPKSSLGPRTGQSARDPKYNIICIYVRIRMRCIVYKCMCAVQYAKKASVTIVYSFSCHIAVCDSVFMVVGH